MRESRGRGEIDLCAFCRVPAPTSNEEEVERIKKLVETENAYACYQLAGCYAHGVIGMPQDWSKVNELYLRAGELGCAEGYHYMGHSYDNGDGVDMDKKKANHLYELAAMNGDVYARYNLGVVEERAGNIDRAMKHFVLSARTGDKDSLDRVKKGFMQGIVTKDEFANTLRVNQKIRDEMKSDTRDRARAVGIPGTNW
jgi:TPR repeat protein